MTLLGNITDYLGATKVPHNRYEELFITPAMPYHASSEPVSIPRTVHTRKDGSEGKHIFPINGKDEVIAERLANGGWFEMPSKKGKMINVRIKPFKYRSASARRTYRCWRNSSSKTHRAGSIVRARD